MIYTKGNEKGIKVSLQKKSTKHKRYNTGNKGQESYAHWKQRVKWQKSLLIINILNINSLNSPIKTEVGRMDSNKHGIIICCLQETTLDPETKIGWKWKDGKRYSMEIVNKRVGMAALVAIKHNGL